MTPYQLYKLTILCEPLNSIMEIESFLDLGDSVAQFSAKYGRLSAYNSGSSDGIYTALMAPTNYRKMFEHL